MISAKTRTIPGLDSALGSTSRAGRCDALVMSVLVRPMSGFIPTSEFGGRVSGPPRAFLTAEQRAAARVDPLSFRFTAGRKAGCSEAEALDWIEDAVARGALRPFDHGLVVYRQTRDDLAATGVIGDLSLAAYTRGDVKRHEKTVFTTQRRMATYMRTTRVYGNPAVTAFRSRPELETAITRQTESEPDSVFTTVDGNTHQLWIVEGDAAQRLAGAIPPPLYIMDGHHRLASAALVASDEGRDDDRLPVGVFAAGQLRLRAFARCIDDKTIDPEGVVASLGEALSIEEVGQDDARPREPLEFGARIGERHYRILVPGELTGSDHHESLNTNLLQRLVLGPAFGIEDSRNDGRLRFVADLGDVEETCSGADAWFLPYPLQVTDVMSVADSARTMPPKSTWFAPKLPSGLVIRPLDAL